MTAVIATEELGKQYRDLWALAGCTLSIPAGHVVGLVGPNGAGKTTLLDLATGMLAPTTGTIEVLGRRPAAGPAQLARVGYLSQDAPVYAGLPVADHLRLGAHLNPGWDADMARRRIERLGLDRRQKAGTLSGGQRAQLALTLAVAKRPELLILDEPVASLDPLARREFLQDLMETVAEQQVSVVLSSHLISDLERACDYVIVLVDSRVRLAGPVDDLLATHHLLSGPQARADRGGSHGRHRGVQPYPGLVGGPHRQGRRARRQLLDIQRDPVRLVRLPHPRHHPARLRRIRLRPRRHRRPAHPAPDPRHGHHPGHLRRRPVHHPAVDPPEPLPDQPTATTIAAAEANVTARLGLRMTVTATVVPGQPGAWIMSSGIVNAAGRPVRTVPAVCQSAIPIPNVQGRVVQSQSQSSALANCLTSHGMRVAESYQPASHYWPLQWSETGIFLALALALAWYCFWQLNRRRS